MYFFVLDISIAAVDLLQEMTDVELTDDSEDSINSFIDALVKNIFFSLLCLICVASFFLVLPS